MNEAVFLRLLSYDDKASSLVDSIQRVQNGQTLNPVVHVVDPTSFSQIPGSTFAYWVSEHTLHTFTLLPRLDGDNRTVKQGLATADDFRFVRLWWEILAKKVVTGTSETNAEEFREQTYAGNRWVPFAKGGIYSRYYSDIHLVVDWERDGKSLKEWICQRYEYLSGKWEWVIKNTEFYFSPGLTWPRRTTSNISVRILPKGGIFSDKGPTVFANHDDLSILLALMNSLTFESFVTLQLGAADAAARSYEAGVIQKTPIPRPADSKDLHLDEFAISCVNLKRNLDTANETSHVFHLPALIVAEGDTLTARAGNWQERIGKAEQELAEYQRQIDDIAFQLYGITGEDRQSLEASLKNERQVSETDEIESEDEENDTKTGLDARSLVADLLSYCAGSAFGRWDIRFATGERPAPNLPDPFAPLPVCSPGMLTGDDGLPLCETPAIYPLMIDWEGILVDDPDHLEDIVRRVRDVLKVIWHERAEAIEQEVCQILSFKELRDYFRKSGNGGFWMDHVRRYSKSRRKAPIYWLLQSSKRNYALWLYYHRLDKDILFKALTRYVEPKIRLEEGHLEQVKAQIVGAGSGGREVKQLEKQRDHLDSLLMELYDFRDKLRRAADLNLEPDLNDGVALNIAPLWELVPWSEAKKYWQELLAGKYEWSSISKQLRAKGNI